MFVARNINADHKDIIYDVAYDLYGRRLATSSADQSIKVWDLGEDGEWKCTASWIAHNGYVWKVTWAHPQFGQVLASCSFDRTTAIWEELVEGRPNERNESHWVKRTSLEDSRSSVTDVRFSPKHLGLQLATCSSDGRLRIYLADEHINLSRWSLKHDIACKISCSCLAWNLSLQHPPMIAVGSDNPSLTEGGKVLIFEYSEFSRYWNKVETVQIINDPVHDISFAPNLGRSYHLLGIASKEVMIISLKPIGSTNLQSLVGSTQTLSKFELKRPGHFDDHNSQVWRVSWNVTGTLLASAGDDGCIRLWKANFFDHWKCVGVIKADGTSNSEEIATTASAPSGMPASSVKYFTLGQVCHPGQVPWH